MSSVGTPPPTFGGIHLRAEIGDMLDDELPIEKPWVRYGTYATTLVDWLIGEDVGTIRYAYRGMYHGDDPEVVTYINENGRLRQVDDTYRPRAFQILEFVRKDDPRHENELEDLKTRPPR